MTTSAVYLIKNEKREPYEYVPELSRRARGIEMWAALKSLGRDGLAELIARPCEYASRFAEGLKSEGCEVPNEVVLNPVLVSFGDDDATRRVIAAIQEDGACWRGGTVWRDRAAMRISMSSWANNESDYEWSFAAIRRVAGEQIQPRTANNR